MEKPQSNKARKVFGILFLVSLISILTSIFIYPGPSSEASVVQAMSYVFPAMVSLFVISLIGWALSWGNIARKIFIGILILILILVLTYTFITRPTRLKGRSMEPSYMDGQQLMINKITYKFSEPARGDVIVYKFQGNDFIGRIVGLPGEEVVINKGSVLINGGLIDEPYAHWEKYDITGSKAFRLKGDEYLLLNDNRNSLMNVIRQQDIIGKIYLIRI